MRKATRRLACLCGRGCSRLETEGREQYGKESCTCAVETRPRRGKRHNTRLLIIVELTATWLASFLFGPSPTKASETEGGIELPLEVKDEGAEEEDEDEDEDEPDDHDAEDDGAVWVGTTCACPEREKVEVEESLRSARDAWEDDNDAEEAEPARDGS